MIIFRRESLAKHTPSREIMGIERVHTANLLEVWLLDNLSFAVHIENTLYPMYLSVSTRLKKQLNQAALDIVFQSLVLNKITYPVQSFWLPTGTTDCQIVGYAQQS